MRPRGPTTAWRHQVRDQGKFAQAEAIQRSVLALRLKARGVDHPSTTTSSPTWR